jgi:hypothetical protein
MDQARVKELISLLDSEVPREGAKVWLHQYGGGLDECQFKGNRAGYLRFGIEFLKAAYQEPNEKYPNAVDVDLAYLLSPGSTIHFGWFERTEEVHDAPGERSLSMLDHVIPLLIIGVLATGVLLAIVGLVTVVTWLL